MMHTAAAVRTNGVSIPGSPTRPLAAFSPRRHDSGVPASPDEAAHVRAPAIALPPSLHADLSARVMTISRRQVDNIHVVQIERPEHRNAVDAATALELADAFREFDADERSDVAILTGAGDHFCAGADLKAYARGDRRKVTDEGDGPMGPTRMRLSKPVIAAVEGYAVAGGCELALWCDLRVASQTAIFGIFCRRFGVPLIDLGTIRLPRLIGHSRAMDLILTGREVRAQEAFDIGLANRVVPYMEIGRASCRERV